MDHVVFPLTVARFSSVVSYNTTIVPMDSGHEARAANWDDARLKFNASSGIKTTADLEVLIKFFRSRKGAARPFMVKDWSDFKLTNQFLASSGSYVATAQITKTYSDVTAAVTPYPATGNADIREITKPVYGTLRVYSNGGLLTDGTHYTCDYTTGIISFSATYWNYTAGAATYTCDCEFYVPVRFEQDELHTDLILWKINNGLGEMPDVPLIEVRDFN